MKIREIALKLEILKSSVHEIVHDTLEYRKVSARWVPKMLTEDHKLQRQWLQRYGWEILPHPAHSPDLAPFDFYLFGPLKRHLGGMAFETEDDLISELRNWFDNLDVDFFRVGINSLLSRSQKCIHLHGDYVEN
ncbi:histone-lysine N-methyltransferase SETMAR [Plakobranchus ocellatus]|uniref:Histone-lysine N-methyltransferase SETMAR n=1 Tax=Plakobranchus ocellatus TaxID=259542 RepID=A0AAV4CIV6_9GAST|nr:histone-lysine N-methyltransferase SETMAR [Plakobranchus ocellatus]